MYSNSNKTIASNSKLGYLRGPSNSNKLTGLKENEKLSQIVANNIVYNTPSSKITSNYNSNAIHREETPLSFKVLTDREDNKFVKENKELKEEILNLKKKNLEKDIQLKEKDIIIKELREKLQKSELENTKAKDKINKLQQRVMRRPTDNSSNKIKTEDEELALALEKINDMERRNSGIYPNNNVFNNDSNRNNLFGFNIDPSDIVNVNSLSEHPFFSELFQRFSPNPQLTDNFTFLDEHNPIFDYENQIVDELCPNPDNMTYEQLLDLQEKVGNVEKGFTKSEIEKIQKIKFNKAIYKNIDKCSVCQYDYNQNEILRKLTCGHIYHRECIDEWLLKDKKCPMCKMEVAIIK